MKFKVGDLVQYKILDSPRPVLGLVTKVKLASEAIPEMSFAESEVAWYRVCWGGPYPWVNWHLEGDICLATKQDK